MYKEHRTVLNKFQLLFSQRISGLARICLYLCLYIYMYPYSYLRLHHSQVQTLRRGLKGIHFTMVFYSSQHHSRKGRLKNLYLLIPGLLTLTRLSILERTSPSVEFFRKQTIRIKTQSSSEYLSFLIRQCSNIYEVSTPRLFLRDVPPEEK